METAMTPAAITLRNYRAFAAPVELELRPITLLFGSNNSGKSALLRSLPLLGDSVSAEARGALDLESAAVRGSTFHDLRWKGIGEDEDPDLGLGLRWNGGGAPVEVEYHVTWFSEWRRLILRQIAVEVGGEGKLTGSWVPRPDEREGKELTYELGVPEAPRRVPVRIGFRGLVPETYPEEYRPLLDPVKERLQELRGQIQWLSALRQPPSRIVGYSTAPRWRIHPDGSDATKALTASPELLEEVSAWYERHFDRELHLLEVPGSGFRLMLRHLKKAELDVDLVDAGEGLVQVLPVLVALALGCRRSSGGPGILAFEEPESHLHPPLQRALAHILCASAMGESSPRLVVETHSEHLLLGVQLEIVEGRLRPEDVQVYWVRQLPGGQSVAESVTFDRKARPQGNWPPEVFSEDTEVARAILRARRELQEP
jgi:hypothetical protein